MSKLIQHRTLASVVCPNASFLLPPRAALLSTIAGHRTATKWGRSENHGEWSSKKKKKDDARLKARLKARGRTDTPGISHGQDPVDCPEATIVQRFPPIRLKKKNDARSKKKNDARPKEDDADTQTIVQPFSPIRSKKKNDARPKEDDADTQTIVQRLKLDRVKWSPSRYPEEQIMQLLAPTVPEELLDFRSRLYDSDLDAVLKIYPQLLRKELLEARDTLNIAQLLHHTYRAEKDVRRRGALKSHVKSFQHDFVSGALPPHRRASMHLIGYFKESKNYDMGIEFWNWVIEQDDNYINLGTYGAAIELLACFGKDLEYCEAVYKHALTRFAIYFNEYHLSPGAILPDRAEHLNAPWTSMQLLQGILTARLLHGDWRNAYLTLDTALRIHPSQIPSRFIELFLRERPLQEAYHVFCLACRAGNQLSGALLTDLLEQLYTAMSNRRAVGFNQHIVGAMFNAIHAFIGSASGGRLAVPHMNVLLKGLLSLLTPGDCKEGSAGAEPQMRQKRFRGMVALIPDVFGSLGVPPERSTFNTLINMGGILKSRELIAFAVNSFNHSGCSPDASSFRTLEIAAARLYDVGTTSSSWTQLVRLFAAQGAGPVVNWSAFVRAAQRAGMEDVVTELMPSQPQDSVKESTAPIAEIKQATSPTPSQDSMEAHAKESSYLFELILAELKSLRKRFNSRLTCDLKTLPLNRLSITPWTPRVDESWQQRLYDELTLDSAVPTVKSSAQTNEFERERLVVESATGFPLEELRYLNWRSVNEILVQAEPFEAKRERLVDEAIARGETVPKSNTSRFNSLLGKDSTQNPPTLQTDLNGIMAACTQPLTESEWRAKILRLRRTDHGS